MQPRCPFCQNPAAPSWTACQCPGARQAQHSGFPKAWKAHQQRTLSQPHTTATPPEQDQPAANGPQAAKGPQAANRPPNQPVSVAPPQEASANPANAIQKMMVAKAVKRFARVVAKRLERVGADGDWFEAAAAAFLKGEELPVRPPSREELEEAKQAELRRLLGC